MMSLVGFEGWQADVEVDCKDAYYNDGNGREDLEQGRADAGKEQQPIDHPASGAGQGIDVLSENQRHLVDQHVAEYSSCRTCYASHYDVHPHRVSGHQAFLDSHNREKAQADGVEDEESVLQPHYPPLENDHDYQGQKCDECV